MVRVARAMIEATFHADGPAPSAGEAWWQATAGNADAMGWPSTGRIQEDAEADLVVFKPDIPWREAYNPLGMVMFAYDDRWLKATVVNGEVVYAAGD